MHKLISVSLLLCLVLVGCAGIEAPSPGRVMAPLTGTQPVHIGESKDTVLDKWGEPDEIKKLGTDDVGLRKEAWVYHGGHYEKETPVDYSRYFYRTQHLVFTGNSLTSIDSGDKSKGSSKE